MKLFSTTLISDVFISLFLLAILIGCSFIYLFKMPGQSFRGPAPALSPQEMDLSARLRQHVTFLAKSPRGRNTDSPEIMPIIQYINDEFSRSGYVVMQQNLSSGHQTFTNLQVELRGHQKPDEIVAIGAHYDTVFQCPGANDNSSGVSVLLEIARHLAGKSPLRTIRFVAFTNEEPPFFQTETMGSLVYARQAYAKHENIVAMISLETIGYYSTMPNSQQYPPFLNYFFPDVGNFVAFVGNLTSRALVIEAIGLFRHHATIASEGIAAPSIIPGIGWSDQWAFWQYGYPAIMVTDTAPFRYPYYHTVEDTPDKLDYDAMARVAAGLFKVVEGLGQS